MLSATQDFIEFYVFKLLSHQIHQRCSHFVDEDSCSHFSENRVLAEPFVTLPTRKELPDYYQLIKTPIDIRKIKVLFISF